MKKLFLIRHAKSDQKSGVEDFDRPLNERGKRDAPKMSQRLKERVHTIDAIVSSPANRALSTANYFADTFNIKEHEIILKKELYLPEPLIFFKVISNISDTYTSVAIFSHNNGITEFANALGVARIDHMPTCSIFAISADSDSWKEFARAEKQLLFFDYPKSED